MIRDFINKDILDIEILGKNLHNNYKFSLDTFSKCKVIEINNSIIGFNHLFGYLFWRSIFRYKNW